jgi:hypothetical protein
MNYYSTDSDTIISDFLTNKLIELEPKDILSENKTNFIQNYENLENSFLKEYVMNSYPCLIKNSAQNFGTKGIIEMVVDILKNKKNLIILFEYRENPFTQFFNNDFQYLKASYNTFMNATKNISHHNYFLNEFSISQASYNLTKIAYDKYLRNNYLVSDLDLNEIYLSNVTRYVVVWGHMEMKDEFICIEEGSLEFIMISIILISDFIKPKIENYISQDLFNLINENKLAKIAMVFMMGKYIGQIIYNAGAFEVFCDNKLLWSTIEHNGNKPNLSTIVRLVKEMK